MRSRLVNSLILLLFSLPSHGVQPAESCASLLSPAPRISIYTTLRGSQIEITKADGAKTVFEGPDRYNYIKIGRPVWEIKGTSPVWNADRSVLAAIFNAKGDSNVTGLTSVYFFDLYGQEKGHWPLERGDQLIWPLNDQNRIMVQFQSAYYAADWVIDRRANRDLITVGTDILDVKTGKRIATVAHAKGWRRFEQEPPLEKWYVPTFQVVWSRTGNHFAELEKDTVKIFEFNMDKLIVTYVRTSSTKDIVDRVKNTIGLFETPASRFERELALGGLLN